jgi:hypothetical protein
VQSIKKIEPNIITLHHCGVSLTYPRKAFKNRRQTKNAQPSIVTLNPLFLWRIRGLYNMKVFDQKLNSVNEADKQNCKKFARSHQKTPFIQLMIACLVIGSTFGLSRLGLWRR